MGKILALLLFCFGFTWADDNWGIIESIDNANKIIVVNKTKIKVLPFTEIDEEVCGENGFYGRDIPRKFADLKVGQMVELDFMGVENGVLLVEDIEIKCSNWAY